MQAAITFYLKNSRPMANRAFVNQRLNETTSLTSHPSLCNNLRNRAEFDITDSVYLNLSLVGSKQITFLSLTNDPSVLLVIIYP